MNKDKEEVKNESTEQGISAKNNNSTETIVDNAKKDQDKKSKLIKMPRAIKHIFILILLVIFIFAGIMIGKNFNTSEVVTGAMFKNMGDLVTQEAYVTVVEDSKNDREFFKLFPIPFTESRKIFSYDVIVIAGTDFSNIEVKSIDDENKTINLKVPHSRVMEEESSLKIDSLHVFLDEDSWFSRIDLAQTNEAFIKMKKKAIETATKNGIIDRADENAKVLITNFIKQDKYKNYNINIEYK